MSGEFETVQGFGAGAQCLNPKCDNKAIMR